MGGKASMRMEATLPCSPYAHLLKSTGLRPTDSFFISTSSSLCSRGIGQSWWSSKLRSQPWHFDRISRPEEVMSGVSLALRGWGLDGEGSYSTGEEDDEDGAEADDWGARSQPPPRMASCHGPSSSPLYARKRSSNDDGPGGETDSMVGEKGSSGCGTTGLPGPGQRCPPMPSTPAIRGAARHSQSTQAGGIRAKCTLSLLLLPIIACAALHPLWITGRWRHLSR